MTEQEAVCCLEEQIKIQPCGNVALAFELAIKALEKQIPKKPIVKQWCPAICPTCKRTLSESKGDGYWQHYTSLSVCDCGQKLDWSEV